MCAYHETRTGVVFSLLGERQVMDETFCSAIFKSSASVRKGPCPLFPLLAHFINLDLILSFGSDSFKQAGTLEDDLNRRWSSKMAAVVWLVLLISVPLVLFVGIAPFL